MFKLQEIRKLVFTCMYISTHVIYFFKVTIINLLNKLISTVVQDFKMERNEELLMKRFKSSEKYSKAARISGFEWKFYVKQECIYHDNADLNHPLLHVL